MLDSKLRLDIFVDLLNRGMAIGKNLKMLSVPLNQQKYPRQPFKNLNNLSPSALNINLEIRPKAETRFGSIVKNRLRFYLHRFDRSQLP